MVIGIRQAVRFTLRAIAGGGVEDLVIALTEGVPPFTRPVLKEVCAFARRRLREKSEILHGDHKYEG